jgi:starvation-inducible outer membrane lipoprotein
MKNKTLFLYGIFFSLFLLISGCISIPVLKNKSDYGYKSNYEDLESSDKKFINTEEISSEPIEFNESITITAPDTTQKL